MKKLFMYLLVPFLGLLFTGCFNIIEEVRLDKNGSGQYAITYDMSGLFTDPMMKSIMLEALKENGELDLGANGALEMDSVMYLKENSDFADIKVSDKLRESAKLHMVMSEKKGEFYANFAFNFDNVNEIGTFFQSMAEGSGQAGMGGFESLLNGNGFTFKKKCLTRTSEAASTETALNEEEMSMMKMFMADAKFKTTYHFPGKVKKSTMKNAEIKGKTVSVTTPILDLMENTKAMDGEIRFKNR